MEDQGTEGSMIADSTEEVGESSSILILEELGKAQRYDATLANIYERKHTKAVGRTFGKKIY